MKLIQKTIQLKPRPNGFFLVTDEILRHLPELHDCHNGSLHLQLLHTSASLTLNENADPDVRHDLKEWAEKAAARRMSWYRHTLEGDDDMPAHIKSSLFGSQLQLAIQNGRPVLGTWQGIWLGEHRDHAGPRMLHCQIWKL